MCHIHTTHKCSGFSSSKYSLPVSQSAFPFFIYISLSTSSFVLFTHSYLVLNFIFLNACIFFIYLFLSLLAILRVFHSYNFAEKTLRVSKYVIDDIFVKICENMNLFDSLNRVQYVIQISTSDGLFRCFSLV